MLNWQNALQSKAMKKVVLAIYLVGIAGTYEAHLRVSRTVPDAIAFKELPTAIASRDLDSGLDAGLPHLTPVNPATSVAVKTDLDRLAIVPKMDSAMLPEAPLVQPDLAMIDPRPTPVVRVARLDSARMASISHMAREPEWSAFAAAFPERSDSPADASGMTSVQADIASGSAAGDLAQTSDQIATDKSFAPTEGEVISSQAPADGQGMSTAAHVDTPAGGDVSTQVSPQPSSDATGELPPIDAQPMG